MSKEIYIDAPSGIRGDSFTLERIEFFEDESESESGENEFTIELSNVTGSKIVIITLTQEALEDLKEKIEETGN